MIIITLLKMGFDRFIVNIQLTMGGCTHSDDVALLEGQALWLVQIKVVLDSTRLHGEAGL